MNPKIDDFIERTESWKAEIIRLRELALESGLTEELKWRQPCYTFDEKNIVLIGKFKEFLAFSFFKGVLLQDADQLLVAPGENSRTVRMFKFTNLDQINALETKIKAYIQEALEIEKQGLKVDLEKDKKTDLPEELETILNNDAPFKKAFESLTLGRQRGYVLYFSAAKQSSTRISRIEKYRQRIIDGFGFHDCICGLTKKSPSCDGSHKVLKDFKK